MILVTLPNSKRALRENNIMVIFLLKIWGNLKEYGLGFRRSKCENSMGWISFMTSWSIQAILTLKQKRCQFHSFSKYVKNFILEHCFNNAFHTWLSPRLSFLISQPQVYSVFVYKYCSVIWRSYKLSNCMLQQNFSYNILYPHISACVHIYVHVYLWYILKTLSSFAHPKMHW